MYVLRPFPILDSEYFINYILTDAFTIPALDAAMRVAMPKVNREALGCFPILLPPIHEQREIAATIKKLNEQIDTFQYSISNEIKSLHEFKSVIISNAVTGKIKI